MTSTVSFDGVSKCYRRGRERANLRAIVPGRFGESVRRDVHWALRDISFELAPGRSLGIVGPNGAGKSTVLKLVAHVIAPTSGRVTVRGRSSSLIELGAGFHPDMTGRENIYFSAALLGMGPKSLRSRFEEIIAFADIGQYIDTPVKRYSSGMLARLGFAVASHLDAELVVLDEVLAVGDAAFQRKCHERIAALRQTGASLLYVTHALWTLPALCDDAILLMNGGVAASGTPSQVLEAYERERGAPRSDRSGDGSIFGAISLSSSRLSPGEEVIVDIELDLPEACPDGRIMLLLATPDDQYLGACTSDSAHVELGPGRTSLRCHIRSVPLQPGSYVLGVVFFADRRVPVFDDARKLWFEVEDSGAEVNPAFGAIHLQAGWRAAQVSTEASNAAR